MHCVSFAVISAPCFFRGASFILEAPVLKSGMICIILLIMEVIKMNELENARKEINEIDREIAALFERRMKMSALIGKYKYENALPVRDAERERLLTEKNLSYITNSEIKPYYVDFLGRIIDLSCEYQQKLREEVSSGEKK